MNAMAITNALLATTPGGNTPTTAALTLAGDYLNTLATPNQRFMVLVTDGAATCGPGNVNAADDANAIMAVPAGDDRRPPERRCDLRLLVQRFKTPMSCILDMKKYRAISATEALRARA